MTDFGVFVCSTCSGIHRDMTHKVKGIGMSNFSELEAKSIAERGNKVSKRIELLTLVFILLCKSMD